MNKLFRYVSAYMVWIANLLLTLWLAYLARTCLISLFALFYPPGNLAYLHRADFFDRAFSIALGLGWLVFMIWAEAHFRGGAAAGDLLKRIANVTGRVVLGIFTLDLILFWFQAGSAGWLRWLVLAIELGVGIVLLVSAKTRFASHSN